MWKDRFKIAAGIILTVLFFILVGAYLFRSWIRTSFLPYGASHFAQQALEKVYVEAYNSVSEPTSELQIKFDPEAYADCQLFEARSYKTSVTCTSSSSGNFVTPDTYLASFKQNSPRVEQKILERGWTKVHNSAQPIDELFSKPNIYGGIGVNYEKDYGKNTCTLSIFSYTDNLKPPALHYFLRCSRYLYFFGDPI